MRRFPSRLLVCTLAFVAFGFAWPSAQGGGGRGGAQAPPGAGGRAGGAGPGRAGTPPRDSTTQTTIGTGAISGLVVTEGSGAAVRRARVTLSGSELRGTRSTFTDDQGRFTFASLPAGRFTMTASKAGYVDNTYGAKRAGRPGTQIQLAESQKLERAVINLPKGGVLTGTVVDEHGEPSPGTQVRALRYVIRTGERTLQQAGQDTTDDRGVYRIYQLQPGDYIVNALPRNMTASDLRQSLASEISTVMQQLEASGGRGGAINLTTIAGLAAGRGGPVADRLAMLQQQLSSTEAEQATAYAPVYYPGTTEASAAGAIALGVGEERTNVDFQLQLVATSRVGGIVTNPAGALPQGTQVGLVPADRGALPNLPGLGNTVTRVGSDGRFSFPNVTPGRYLVQARATIRQTANGDATDVGRGGRGQGPGGSVSEVLWASAPIDVTGTPQPETLLTLQPGMTVSGRVTFEGTTTTPVDPASVRVSLSTRGQQMFELGGGTSNTETDASGRFTIVGVSPGRYSLSAGITNGGARGAGAGGRGGAANAPVAGQATTRWVLKSAMLDSRDILDFPLEIGPNQSANNVTLTFTNRTQELTGTIQDTAGGPTSDFTIIVFPAEERYWLPQSRRIAAARPSTDGRFAFTTLPAGDYRLTAVTDVEPGEWFDPAFLTQLTSASLPLSIGEGEKKVQDIRLAAPR